MKLMSSALEAKRSQRSLSFDFFAGVVGTAAPVEASMMVSCACRSMLLVLPALWFCRPTIASLFIWAHAESEGGRWCWRAADCTPSKKGWLGWL